MRRIFIIAGEASGDLHGANLVKALLEQDGDQLEIQAYGGPKMAAAGASVLRSYEDYAFMGFYEVLINARKVLRNLRETCGLIQDFEPDIIVFIDFPGFNLRVAKTLRSVLSSAKFCYYISPKVWAWKGGRVHLIDRLMDEVYVIFPFEEAFYARYGYKVQYVGNPLRDEITTEEAAVKDEHLIAILPGSRKQEIEKMLPVFSILSAEMPDFRFEVSVMPHFTIEFYKKNALQAGENLIFSERSTYDLLREAGAAIVTSGTATLETALFRTPQVVAYKSSPISYAIAKQVVKIKYISLVNLILDKPAVKELIQGEMTVAKLKGEIEKILMDDSEILADYDELERRLGEPGASRRTAKLILGHVEG